MSTLCHTHTHKHIQKKKVQQKPGINFNSLSHSVTKTHLFTSVTHSLKTLIHHVVKVLCLNKHNRTQQSFTHPGSFLSSAGDPDAISWCCCCCWCSIIIIFIVIFRYHFHRYENKKELFFLHTKIFFSSFFMIKAHGLCWDIQKNNKEFSYLFV